ncbi:MULTISPECIES: GLPGLI family protein [Weeksella]|uniref:GLPGLI family protein n=1 Tax=Weeksella TaxID=1013 RepID=UPI0008A5F3A8|nr:MULTISPECIES: GLPGLI family protein [Weeksella]MDK7374426.1 GLPGLI family protein [Weeksella virosa]OFM81815.1 hypothetical protein HMPREF2660_05530 [Weeksella sp. HMSC059D05]
MKQFIYTCLIAFSAIHVGFAQNQNIEATYVMKIDLNVEENLKNVPKAFQSEARKNLETANKEGVYVDYTLKADGKKSVYQLVEKISNDNSISAQVVKMMTMMDKEPLYKLIDNNEYTKLYDMFGKRYQIKDQLINFNWKITREKTKINGYDVTKATGVINDSIPVTAWYAPQITVKDGPDRFWGLPGLIVKVDGKNEKADFSIQLKDLKITDKPVKINVPTEKKTYTMKEYEEEMRIWEQNIREQMNQGVETD